jgi:hypothetical protein
LESRVYVKNVAGNSTAEIAREKHGGISDFRRIGIAAQRCVLLNEIENLGEVLNSARGNRFDGAG